MAYRSTTSDHISHRRDDQTTLYHIALQPEQRCNGVGRRLVDALVQDAGKLGRNYVQLKCPVDLEANGFYEHLRFSRMGVQHGKNRDLVIWRLPLDSSILLEDGD